MAACASRSQLPTHSITESDMHIRFRSVGRHGPEVLVLVHVFGRVTACLIILP
jgi:hypothetical protein